MSEEDEENWEYTRIKVPSILIQMAEKLSVLKMGEVMVDLKSRAAVIREAVARGLRVMMIERAILDEIVEENAAGDAERIYSSLVMIPAEGAGETVGKGREAPAHNSEELKVEEEDVEVEEEEEEPDE